MNDGARRVAALGLILAAAAPPPAPDPLAPEAAPAATPFFVRPFAGEHRLLNVFDHDLPLGAADRNRRAVDWRGRRVRAGRAQDGHAGYDFAMPVGTPVLAAAPGRVVVAGAEAPHACHLRPGLASALWVKVQHALPPAPGSGAGNGEAEQIVTNYVHLSRIDVSAGDRVAAGQPLGLSGNTGCSTLPHLHFAAARTWYTRDGTRTGVWFDPSGWRGRGRDPWVQHPQGAASTRLWREGEAPAGL
jgi:murein DD-endopeptidase MepM/ murein hydrolase activator NlpD